MLNLQAIRNRLLLRVEKKIEDVGKVVVKEVQKSIDTEADKFFVVVASVLGHSNKPSLATFSETHWPPLMRRTVLRKKHDKFFLDTGNLISVFKSKRNATNQLGKTRVRKVNTKTGTTYTFYPFGKMNTKVASQKTQPFLNSFNQLEQTKILGPKRYRPSPSEPVRSFLPQMFYHFITYRLKRAGNAAIKTIRR